MGTTLEDVLKKFNKGKENDSVVQMADKTNLKKKTTSTGSPYLDLLTGGGHAQGGFNLIVADGGTGKSSKALLAIKEELSTDETTPTKEVSSEGNSALRAAESTAKALGTSPRTERSFDKVNVGDNITHNGKQGKVFAKVRPKGSLSHPVVLAKDAEGKVFRVTESEYKGTKEGDGDNVLKTNGKLVSYRNDVGRIVVDEENNVIFEGSKSSVELGKTTDEEFAAKSIGDIGISYVNENSLNQAILVDNTVYVKGEQQELVRINYDKNDNVVSYTYKNSKGHERTNRNYEAALDVAIQKNNQEFDKSRNGASDEVKQRDEEHISGDFVSIFGKAGYRKHSTLPIGWEPKFKQKTILKTWHYAMGIPEGYNFRDTEVSEGIPPAYTKYIGEHLIQII